MNQKFMLSLSMVAIAIAIPILGCRSSTVPAAAPAVSTDESRNVTERKSGADWQTKWDDALAGAKKEGKVSLYAHTNADVRAALIKNFEDKFGLELDLLLIPGALAQQRVANERRAGIFYPDAIISGGGTIVAVLKPQGFFEPFSPYLLLPEVTDPRSWEGGVLPYLDKDQQIIAFSASVSPYIVVNTDMVKPAEITSYHDLLAPKWKGKIVLQDPSATGSGSGWFAMMMMRVLGKDKGIEYMRRFVEQAPVITRDVRLQVEWLAHRKYPIAVGPSPEEIAVFKSLGARLEWAPVAEGASLSPTTGIIALFRNAPHPNARTVFVNWLLGKEGQTIFSNAFGSPSIRTDVPEVPGLDPARVPRPGQKYYINDEEYYMGKDDLTKMAKDIFGPLLK